MTTLVELAQRGIITKEIRAVAKSENVSEGFLNQKVASGRVVVPKNINRTKVRLAAVGEGFSTKVNVNVGTTTTRIDLGMELEKAKVALKYGTDTIMDLSIGGDLDLIRRKLMEVCDIPFGTVPIYQAYIDAARKFGSPVYMNEDLLFNTVAKQLKDGVDFITVHTGITKELAMKLQKTGRTAGMVSRGGATLMAWMLHNGVENPLYSNYNYLLELAAQYDATLSLGDALRPGSVIDAHDEFQVLELVNNAKLARAARTKQVQVMIEGPGHMPLNKVVEDVRLEKILSDGTPYYVLGPLVTDTATGYDHIAAAIGAALASMSGVDLICYLTPSEHLSLPNAEQVKEGLIAARIAAHAGDLVKLGEKAARKDLEMSLARSKLDWKTIERLSFDPERCGTIRKQFAHEEQESCTMCGQMCVYILLQRYFGRRPRPRATKKQRVI